MCPLSSPFKSLFKKIQQDCVCSVPPGIICAQQENCLNNELLVTNEMKFVSLKRVSFQLWNMHHFVSSNTKLMYGRKALGVKWRASVLTLGISTLTSPPLWTVCKKAPKQNWLFSNRKNNLHQTLAQIQSFLVNYQDKGTQLFTLKHF